jgi:hypothetical protein
MNPKDIIYIHPRQYRMFHRFTIPLSLPALIKRIPFRVKGYYPNEITHEIIRNARIAIIDVHWNYALEGAREICMQLKMSNPGIIIIAGGYTASMYPDQLVNQFGVDFVIRGDGEIPLAMLVQTLIESPSDVGNVPNLVGRDNFSTSWSYHLTEADLNKNEFYDLDFFPSYKSDIKRAHSQNFGWPIYTFPFILPFRGCPVDCPTCAGSICEQKKLFGRTWVKRGADKVAEDIGILNKWGGLKFTNIIHDFVSLMSEDYVMKALSVRSDLKLLYEFTSYPGKDRLELLLNSFKGGVIYFSADKFHTQTDDFIEPSKMIELIRYTESTKKYLPVFYYNGLFMESNPDYQKAVQEVITVTSCQADDASLWWEDFPMPDKNGYADPETFKIFCYNSEKSKPKPIRKIYHKLVYTTYSIAVTLLPDKWLYNLKKWRQRKFTPFYK